MKSAQQTAIELIGRLPDDASMETILAGLMFAQTIEERLAAVERGETVSHEEAKKRLSKWLTPAGQ
jgi:predicted transcriptional regulator